MEDESGYRNCSVFSRTTEQDAGKAAKRREKKREQKIKEAEENDNDGEWEEVKRGIPQSSVSLIDLLTRL